VYCRTFLLTLLAIPLQAAEPGRDEAILRRNIFRHSFAKPAPPRRPTATAPRPRITVLTGVIQYGDTPVAVFEEKTAGRVQFLEVGDTIDQGQIASITATSVVVKQGAVERTIELGQTLAGTPAPATLARPSTSAPAASSAAVQPAAAPTPAPAPRPLTGSLKERLEAMKKRRLEQMKKSPK